MQRALFAALHPSDLLRTTARRSAPPTSGGAPVDASSDRDTGPRLSDRWNRPCDDNRAISGDCGTLDAGRSDPDLQDRKSVGEGKSVSVGVDLGGRRTIKKNKM